MDIDKQNLFPEINPNLDEIVEMDKVIDKNEVIKDDVNFSQPKKTHNQIFVNKKEKQNVKLEVSTKKKRDYSHLNEARKKGIITRKEKAAAKKLAKAEAKAKKDEEKRIKREATKERNRQKARERYYKQKEKKLANKSNVAEKIVEKTKPKYKSQLQNGMDFNTFAKYMMKYEGLKKEYNDIQTKKKEKRKKSKPIPIPQPKPKPPYHPPNYPLANFYNPDIKNKNWTGF